jgi:hypothetical protein
MATKVELKQREKVGRFTFNYNEENNFYDCRGEITYDDEHDEIPEPELWNAALILAKRLKEQGYKTEVDHSEKGWVEVNIMD